MWFPTRNVRRITNKCCNIYIHRTCCLGFHLFCIGNAFHTSSLLIYVVVTLLIYVVIALQIYVVVALLIHML